MNKVFFSKNELKKKVYFIFYLNIYPPDFQESNGSANTSN